MKKKSVKIKTPASPRVLLTPVKRKYNFVPGVSGNPAGRKKGSKNKFTTLKDAFINAFSRIGGEDALVKYCTPKPITVVSKKGKVRIIDFTPERQREFFKMIVPMLPKEVAVTGADGAPLPSQVPVVIFQDAAIQVSRTNDKK
jgi:hypothetical protein